MVIVAEQVAQAVDGKAGQLSLKAALAAAAKGSLDRNDNVAQEHASARRVGFAAQILLMKAKHVRGPVVLAKVPVEHAHLFIAGQEQRDLATLAVEQTQGLAQARSKDTPCSGRKERTRLRPDDDCNTDCNADSDSAHNTRL